MTQRERYIIDERELALLDRYEGELEKLNDPHRYDTFDRDVLVDFCRMKDRSNDLFMKRYEAAKEVIDMVARQVGIDPDNTSFWLYTPEPDGTTPIVRRMEDWFSRSGEKAQLKRKVQEQEQQIALLREMLRR